MVAACVTGALTALVVTFEGPSTTGRPADAAAFTLVAMGGLTLTFARTAPVPTFAAALAVVVLYEALGYPGGPAPLPIVRALLVIAAGGSRARSLGLGLLAIILLLGVRAAAVPGGWEPPLIVAFPTAVLVAVYAGQLLATRRQQQHELHLETERRAKMQEEDARRRVDAERLRIARELHDVVAHNISLINVQATMGVHLAGDDPSPTGDALLAIKQASKQALGELRRILDVLRQGDETDAAVSAPGVANLDAMLITLNQAGLPTRLSVRGTPTPLPTEVDVAAYRIIQESLTNALRYAAPAATCVTLDYGPTLLRVEVRDAGRHDGTVTPAGSGHGIPGMRERATDVGGLLQARRAERGASS